MTQSDEANAAAAAAVPRVDPAEVSGWGIDADEDNDPTRPMRDRGGDPGHDWKRPPLQKPTVEILRSTEHRRLPAVLGATLPPRGFSGGLRRKAFTLSESQWGHWLLLMLADRVDVVEGLAEDVLAGILPNPLVETGMIPRSRSREAAVATLALFGVGVAAAVWLTRTRRQD
jgi:hypothetical protein